MSAGLDATDREKGKLRRGYLSKVRVKPMIAKCGAMKWRIECVRGKRRKRWKEERNVLADRQAESAGDCKEWKSSDRRI